MRFNVLAYIIRPPTASDLPGLEASGSIVQIGEGVSNLREGDQVCALLPGGGYAEYATTPAAHCLPVPKGMSLKEAAVCRKPILPFGPMCFNAAALRQENVFLFMGDRRELGRPRFNWPLFLVRGFLRQRDRTKNVTLVSRLGQRWP